MPPPPFGLEVEARLGASRRILRAIERNNSARSLHRDHDLELVKSLEPNAGICDMGLSGSMNGYDIARAVRQDEALKVVS